MNVTVNGVREQLPAGAGLSDLLARAGHGPTARGVAVAVNGEVVRRADWPARALADGDTVELLVAVQGG